MNKKIFIVMLITHSMGANQSVMADNIEELTYKLAVKERELADLTNAIKEKEASIVYIKSKGDDVYSDIYESLSEKEKAEFKNEVDSFESSINAALIHKNDIKKVLMQDFFILSNNKNYDLMRSLIIRYCVEWMHLKKIFEDYEITLQELVEQRNVLRQLKNGY